MSACKTMSFLCLLKIRLPFPFPPSVRWLQTLHSKGASGGGLPRGSLLPHGPLLLHEWRPVPPQDAGQGPGWGHEPDHQQPAHGLWGLCGQTALTLHVYFPQGGCGQPLLQVKDWCSQPGVSGVHHVRVMVHCSHSSVCIMHYAKVHLMLIWWKSRWDSS